MKSGDGSFRIKKQVPRAKKNRAKTADKKYLKYWANFCFQLRKDKVAQDCLVK